MCDMAGLLCDAILEFAGELLRELREICESIRELITLIDKNIIG